MWNIDRTARNLERIFGTDTRSAELLPLPAVARVLGSDFPELRTVQRDPSVPSAVVP
jgi:hypothetical protein